MKMNAKNSMLCYNPGTDEVEVMPLGDRRCRKYWGSLLGCFADVQGMGFQKRKMKVFMEAVHLMVRDNVDPKALHRELMKLEEYRSGCSYDMPRMEKYKPESGDWL